MTTVTDGSTVTFHYKGTLEDGTQFDSSYDRNEPMTVELGNGKLIAGFESALQGMGSGDSKKFTLSPEEAYGNRREDATTTLNKSMFPEDFQFEEGMPIPLMAPNGQQVIAKLLEVSDSTVTADLNHPLAGEELTFEIEVLGVEGDNG
jgi:peptidylprolyl isomerase